MLHDILIFIIFKGILNLFITIIFYINFKCTFSVQFYLIKVHCDLKESAGTTSSRVLLFLKLVHERCRIQSPVSLFDKAVRNFPRFSPKLA